jgi:hypothetical protein
VYAEHNESEDPNKDWEFSVEFYSNEQAEYNFYIAAQRKVQVRPKGARKVQGSRGRKAARSRKHVHKRVLLRTCY